MTVKGLEYWFFSTFEEYLNNMLSIIEIILILIYQMIKLQIFKSGIIGITTKKS